MPNHGDEKSTPNYCRREKYPKLLPLAIGTEEWQNQWLWHANDRKAAKKFVFSPALFYSSGRASRQVEKQGCSLNRTVWEVHRGLCASRRVEIWSLAFFESFPLIHYCSLGRRIYSPFLPSPTPRLRILQNSQPQYFRFPSQLSISWLIFDLLFLFFCDVI